MIDTIFSRKNKQAYAVVDYSQDEEIEFYFRGRIIESSFPAELLALIEEYNGIVDDMALSLVDEVEEKIYAYDLGLKARDSRIFNISIKNKDEISFFTKYPTGNGFRDEYPG